MKSLLAQSIYTLRKQHGMTQEQLAEALDVTFASVSKWERDVATPDLNLIMQMADLFGVSLDAMVGFEVQNNGATELADKILLLQQQKQYDDAIIQAEKALLRYPNNFKVVFRSGQMYVGSGIERTIERHLERGIELLEHSILLLSQNTDLDVSETSIRQEIAQSYISLGKTERGLEILKKYNVNGVFNSLIAIAMVGNEITYTGLAEYNLDEAVPYMTYALGDILTNTLRTMMAYANYYYKKGNYKNCLKSLLWLIDYMNSLKKDVNVVAYVDKVIAPCYSECANMSLILGEKDNVEPYLRLAYKTAKMYDTNPTNQLNNIKFVDLVSLKNAITYDDLGETATSAIVAQITQGDRDKLLYQLWQKIVAEDIGDNK